MRVLRNKENNIYTIITGTRSLTHRICSYGEVNGFWKVLSKVKKSEGVFSVDILLMGDAEKICSHLNLDLE